MIARLGAFGRLESCAGTTNLSKKYYFVLIMYVPSALRKTHIAIGLFLFDHSKKLLRHAFTQDWQRLQAADPNADLEMLAKIPEHFDRLIQESLLEQESSEKATTVGSFYAQLRRMRANQSGAIQVSAPRGVLTANPDQEFDRLFHEHIEGAEL